MCVRLISCFTSEGKKRTVSTSGIRFEQGIGLPPCLAGSSPCNLTLSQWEHARSAHCSHLQLRYPHCDLTFIHAKSAQR